MKQLAISGLKTSFVFLKNRHSKNIILGLLIAFCALISDLASKNLVLEILQQSATQLKATSGNSNNNFLQIRIFDFFSLVYVENRGISFGMFNNLYDSNKIFTLIQGSIACLVLAIMLQSRCFASIMAYGLIFGGAMGNVIDRAQRGAVMDFLDFHLGVYHWPAFNLADSFVFIGVAGLLIIEFTTKPRLETKKS